MLKQHEIQARQQQVLPVGGILCVADSLLGAAEMGSMQGGWNSLFTFPTSVFWAKYSILTEREATEKQERSISQGIFQSRDALELLRAKRALLLNILLPEAGKKKS